MSRMRRCFLVVGDVDRDGHQDIVVARHDAGVITVLRGDGRGGFTRADVPTGPQPVSVAIADADGDHAPDLVVADGAGIDVLPGGVGGFGPAITSPTPARPGPIATADVNGDGRVDVAAGDGSRMRMMVLLGDGAGRFAPAGNPASGAGPSDVSLADVDGDGHRDLTASFLQSRGVTVRFGDGAGGFGPDDLSGTGVASVPMPGDGCAHWLTSVEVAQVVGGPAPDVVAAGTCGVVVSEGLGRGRGFAPAETVRMSALDAVVADADGDRRPDLLATEAAGRVVVLRGDGIGGFARATAVAVGADPRRIATADLNGDGRLDAVTVNRRDGSVSVLLGVPWDVAPGRPGAAPATPLLRRPTLIRRRGAPSSLAVRLARAARVRVALSRAVAAGARGGVRRAAVGAITVRRPAGRSQIRLAGRLDLRRLAPGRYVASVRAGAGKGAVLRTVAFRIAP